VIEVEKLAKDADIGVWVKDQSFGWPWTDAACDAIAKKATEVLDAPFEAPKDDSREGVSA